MLPNRFPNEMAELTDRHLAQPMNGFLMLPIPTAEPTQVSPMQWLYQKLYEQALQTPKQSAVRDLFAVMN